MAYSRTDFPLYPLHPGFVGAKPIEEASDEVFLELEAKGRLIKQRKRNGHAAYVSATGRGKRRLALYSRSIKDLTAHFPALVDELRSMNLPHNTLLAGEMLVQVDGVDSPGAFTSFAGSKPERAVRLQGESSPVRMVLFNVIVHKGKMVVHFPYEDRLDILRNLLAKHSPERVDLVEVLPEPFAAAKRRSVASKWEGLVLYDAKASTEYRLDGKSAQVPRPLGCWKWKDYLEGDFVAIGWIPSTAKSHSGAVKNFKLWQYSPETGELQYWGKCGTGISREDRFRYANDAWKVFEIKFERRTPNSRLIGAHILRERDDKKPEECIAPPGFS